MSPRFWLECTLILALLTPIVFLGGCDAVQWIKKQVDEIQKPKAREKCCTERAEPILPKASAPVLYPSVSLGRAIRARAKSLPSSGCEETGRREAASCGEKAAVTYVRSTLPTGASVKFASETKQREPRLENQGFSERSTFRGKFVCGPERASKCVVPAWRSWHWTAPKPWQGWYIQER